MNVGTRRNSVGGTMVSERASTVRGRRWVHVVGWLTILTAVTAAVEFAGYRFLLHQQQRYRHFFAFDIDRYVDGLNPAHLRMHRDRLASKYIWPPHPTLGWRRSPLSSHFFEESGTTITTDANGARSIPGAAGPVSIVTYGDSFTEGLEVDDPDTWQAQMAYATGTRVLNYGVSAWGPDQALLALEEDLAGGLRSPYVILAMINENLNRMMNTFRSFYTHPTEDVFLGFKPIFAPTDSGFTVRHFAPTDLADTAALRRAIRAASAYDWFYQQRTFRIRFPLILSAARFVRRYGASPVAVWPDYSTGMPRKRIDYLLRRFHDDARTYGFTPVFVLLPESRNDLRTRRGRDHPLFSGVADSNRLPRLIYIDVVKELTGDHAETYVAGMTPDSFFTVTHPSAYGNRAIATVILARLRDQLAALGHPPVTP